MSKYKILPTPKFKKNIRLLEKRGCNMSLLYDVIGKLANGETLSAQYRDHPLKGNRKGYRDCHILSDWVLIYRIDRDILTLILYETGTHADILE
ncbi:MAG: type II toxin-antitoxin system YafQ family toxin [Oscillospiraceae bacterium]|nr:type II toxin-antitoxin system YafQ family toxin [Oscillospiraceae bacterium]